MGAAGKHLSSDTYHLCYGFMVNSGSGLMVALMILEIFSSLDDFVSSCTWVLRRGDGGASARVTMLSVCLTL